MTNDEKAKAYDMALEAARKELGCDRKEYKVVEQVLKSIFPELRESEDERIIKRLSSLVSILNACFFSGDNPSKEECLSYLEKQKEDYSSFSEEQKKYMEKYIPLDKVTLVKLLAERDMNVAESIKSFNECFAEEEQDITFQSLQEAIKEAYEELHSRVAPPDDYCWKTLAERFTNIIEKQKEPEPVKWGEEDRLHYANILEALEYVKGCKSDYDKIEAIKSDIAWLKSLRPVKQELSEKDRKILDDVSHILAGLNYKQVAQDYKQAVENLLSLRPQWKPSEEHLSALLAVFNDPDNIGSATCQLALTDLYEQLKKL